jgi:hypothetical protein
MRERERERERARERTRESERERARERKRNVQSFLSSLVADPQLSLSSPFIEAESDRDRKSERASERARASERQNLLSSLVTEPVVIIITLGGAEPEGATVLVRNVLLRRYLVDLMSLPCFV